MYIQRDSLHQKIFLNFSNTFPLYHIINFFWTILYVKKETTFILLILILFLYSDFHGKKDYKSSEGLNKNKNDNKLDDFLKLF